MEIQLKKLLRERIKILKIIITKIILAHCKTTINPLRFLPMWIITAITALIMTAFSKPIPIMADGEAIPTKP